MRVPANCWFGNWKRSRDETVLVIRASGLDSEQRLSRLTRWYWRPSAPACAYR